MVKDTKEAPPSAPVLDESGNILHVDLEYFPASGTLKPDPKTKTARYTSKDGNTIITFFPNGKEEKWRYTGPNVHYRVSYCGDEMKRSFRVPTTVKSIGDFLALPESERRAGLYDVFMTHPRKDETSYDGVRVYKDSYGTLFVEVDLPRDVPAPEGAEKNFFSVEIRPDGTMGGLGGVAQDTSRERIMELVQEFLEEGVRTVIPESSRRVLGPIMDPSSLLPSGDLQGAHEKPPTKWVGRSPKEPGKVER